METVVPSDTGVMVSAILVIVSVVIKVATASMLDKLKQDVSRLQQVRRGVQERLKSVQEHRASIEDTHVFYEHRKVETIESLESLAKELEQLEEIDRKYQESHPHYDDDESGEESEQLEEADRPPDGELPAPEVPLETVTDEDSKEPTTAYHRPDISIDPSVPLAVIPAQMGKSDEIFLMDALATELLGLGLNVLDRAALLQMVRDQELDPAQMLANEEYIQIGKIAAITIVVIVNSMMHEGSVANATCKVADISTGAIVASTSYDRQAPNAPPSKHNRDRSHHGRDRQRGYPGIILPE